ncbi:sensor histidine kinase [Dactylosporangium vinaceum]|uniref:histidine kinase n=1 Tax=Dactylosporangium vinaceum TaxID=53362 RepID=A0ABV5M1E6_9ACTN|nr:histidine kinase [Dactylosporangium vinaceum]UAB99588.1 sensor histidine kinase [Dactylosporangium vinaceum]
MFRVRWRWVTWAGVADAVLAVVLVAPAIVDPPAGRPFGLQAVVLAGLVLPVLGRRHRPAAVAAVVLGAAWLGLLTRAWAEHLPLAHLSLLVMLYTLVVRARRRVAAAAGLATAGFFGAWTLTVGGSDVAWSLLTYGLAIVTVWLLGERVWARRAYLESVERRAELADSERRALARAAAAEERTRIARELHDVLAHTVSVMVVNAEGAQLVRHTDPAAVDRTLKLVSATGREALTELRRILAVLEAGGPVPPPQPTLADLHRLASSVGVATVRVSGHGDDVPAGVVVQIYRIVQEALTNVVKHAGAGAEARVTVHLGEPGRRRAARIEVRDNGTAGIGTPWLPSSGRGLAGMRERVAMFGGTLEAAERPEGGFRVVATLPLEPARTAFSQPHTDSMDACPTSRPLGS